MPSAGTRPPRKVCHCMQCGHTDGAAPEHRSVLMLMLLMWLTTTRPGTGKGRSAPEGVLLGTRGPCLLGHAWPRRRGGGGAGGGHLFR